jgi:hypothetical protein
VGEITRIWLRLKIGAGFKRADPEVVR